MSATFSENTGDRTPTASTKYSTGAATSNSVPSYRSSVLMSGTRSNAAVCDLRTISTAWSAWNPISFAVIDWSAPRGIVLWPGVTSMR